ncbi:MAG: 2-C-methyl-D-erythritol 2,4-cyclodiphosphate synthase [Actinomycetia bacterium]|nr:2-C-methyl-D-erythritol 2,4-cyclodiphosphate synthase [Actinomycetes bacterium]
MDAHRFERGRKLFLGGVEIPHEKGLGGHSDADVLLHALMDALLGACGAGDIGEMFPDSDPTYRGASSLKLLGEVADVVSERGYRVANVDAAVVCEEPKVAPYGSEMRERIAGCLGIDPGGVSVKGTTTEGLGFTGRGEGVAAIAVALVVEAGG